MDPKLKSRFGCHQDTPPMNENQTSKAFRSSDEHVLDRILLKAGVLDRIVRFARELNHETHDSANQPPDQARLKAYATAVALDYKKKPTVKRLASVHLSVTVET